MKNKLGKKLLVGGTCACLLLTGGLTLSGCSLSADQQKAIDVLVTNTETLVDDFGAYLDGQNAKIDKEKAVEMIAKSRLNFKISNFNNMQMTAKMYMYEGFEDKLVDGSELQMVYKSENGIKISAEVEDGILTDINKSDFNKDLHYRCHIADDQDEENFSKLEYSSNMWLMDSADIFSQIPVGEIGEITSSDIYNIKSIEGGYEFELVIKVTDLTETDLSKCEEDAEVVIYNIIMKIEIKNDYITKVNFKGIQTTVPVKDLKINEDEIIELDKNGVPIIYNYAYIDVVTMIMDVEYKYEDIDYSEIEEKIAEIEERFITQE